MDTWTLLDSIVSAILLCCMFALLTKGYTTPKWAMAMPSLLCLFRVLICTISLFIYPRGIVIMDIEALDLWALSAWEGIWSTIIMLVAYGIKQLVLRFKR